MPSPRPRPRCSTPRRWGPARIRAWSLFANRPAVLGYVLVVDAAALVLTVAAVGVAHPDARDLVVVVLLAVGAVVHGELAGRVERLREIRADNADYVDIKSMWGFAALLLLPLGPALGVVVLTWVHFWFRVSRRPVPHRWTFSASTAVIATVAAAGVLALAPDAALRGPVGPGTLLAVLLAALARSAVNFGLVVVVMALTAPSTTWRARLGRPADHAVDLGALALGTALAGLATTSPWLVPVLLVPLLTMHRGLLFDQLVRAVRTDDKTGLATSAFWHAEATRLLTRGRRRGSTTGVLMVDVDHFKAVNDTYGHVTGDRVLRAVADTLAPAAREGDLVGRFGGEEFVVLLRDTDAVRAAATAERLRRAVAALSVAGASTHGPVTVAGLTVSVGVATRGPGEGPATLDELVLAADGALYSAKRAGRDRVASAAA